MASFECMLIITVGTLAAINRCHSPIAGTPLQVRNFGMTLKNTKKPRAIKDEDKTENQHVRALQALSNEGDVPYDATLRTVVHEGSRTPKLPPRQTQKHPVRVCGVCPEFRVQGARTRRCCCNVHFLVWYL